VLHILLTTFATILVVVKKISTQLLNRLKKLLFVGENKIDKAGANLEYSIIKSGVDTTSDFICLFSQKNQSSYTDGEASSKIYNSK
jgi:hypothetical protein